ncbi:hypothetical protein SASPL_152444 [Salvia splendens]|uniref:Uncharacterized protein n=1 Tax=Salvia splendens TaxID=180675 RepID=A0A8X8Z1A0_SALSN|nr:hypothetical protein SASPL_152444 [Salvia splendens]
MDKVSAPVIDMKDSSNLAEKIVKACEEWGCFRLVNNGVDTELMAEMKAVTRSLMDLPVEVKHNNSHPEPSKGYTPLNITSPYFEGLSQYDIASPRAIDNFCSQIHVMEGLGMDWELLEDWTCQLKMNKYNYDPQSVGLTGILLYSDPGFLTILQDDEIVNGLKAVHHITGEIVSLDPVAGSLVVNVGDVALAWSNGRFCNVKHRVQCYEANVRISIALFVLGPRNEKVEAPPQLLDSGNPCRYVPFDFEEYRKLRSSTKSPTGEALELLLSKTS